MLGLSESVLRGDRLRPLLDLVGRDLDRLPAVAADQMVVMDAGGAGAVQTLAVLLQRVGFAFCREVGEGAVHGRESDRRPGIFERGVQRLRAHESLRVTEGFAHGVALPGVALHVATASPRLTLPRRPRPIRRQTR